MTNFITRCPNFAADVYIVAPELDADRIRKLTTP